MIEGAKWRRWVYFYIPLGAFVFLLLFPFYWMLVTSFRPDNELYRPWMAPNYTPFWTLHPTLDHVRYLLGETLFSTWMLNTLIISIVATVISLFCGLLAGYALSPRPRGRSLMAGKSRAAIAALQALPARSPIAQRARRRTFRLHPRSQRPRAGTQHRAQLRLRRSRQRGDGDDYARSTAAVVPSQHDPTPDRSYGANPLFAEMR
jgi:hypothetical protein